MEEIAKLKKEIDELKIKHVRELTEMHDILMHIYSLCHKIGTELKYEVENHLKLVKDILDMERMQLYREGLSEKNPFEKKNVHRDFED